jgi:hypothetical protein
MKLLLLSLLLLTSFASCRKDVNQLPEPSSSGKNFLAYKVNGVIRQYSGLSDRMNRVGVDYSRFVDKIAIATGGEYDEVGIYIKAPPASVTAGVIYNLGSEVGSHYAVYAIKGKGQPSIQYRTSASSGWVRFSRVDTAVSAGTFAFTAYTETPNGLDSVVITEGVFDIALP